MKSNLPNWIPACAVMSACMLAVVLGLVASPARKSPDFTVAFVHVHDCTPEGQIQRRASFKITNTGDVAFIASVKEIRDLATGEILYRRSASHSFETHPNGCAAGSLDSLEPGQSAYISITMGDHRTYVYEGRLTISLYPRAYPNLDDVTRTADFSYFPPK